MQQGRKSVGHPVDVASGTLYSDFQDLSLDGQMPLEFRRHYSTSLLEQSPSFLGRGWFSPVFSTLLPTDEGVRYVNANGDQFLFSDSEALLRRGETIRLIGPCLELSQEAQNKLVVTEWDIKSFIVTRYVFMPIRKREPWRLRSVEGPSGEAVDIEYDENSKPVQIVQRRESRYLEILYDRDGLIQSLFLHGTDKNPHLLVRFEYDVQQHLISASDAIGATDHFEYDKEGKLVRVFHKDAGVWNFSYDAEGRCVQTTGQDRYEERTLRFFPNTTHVANSHGAVEIHRWLNTGQVWQTVSPKGAQSLVRYDEHGRIIEEIEANGASVKYAYDAEGNLAETSNALGQTMKFYFNKRHQLIAFENPGGSQWTRQYDHNGHIAAVQGPLGVSARFYWSDNGDLLEFVNARGDAYAFKHDEYGNVVRAINPDGAFSEFRYDSFGHLIEKTNPEGGRTLIEYDQMMRLASWTDPDGHAASFEYDANGNRIRIVDFDGSETMREYGSCGRLVKEMDPDGSVTRYEWDSEPDTLLKIHIPAKGTYSYEYDAEGNLSEEVGFDGRTIRYERDPNGLVTLVINSAGEITRFERNILGQIIRKIGFDGSVSEYDYDPQSNLMTLAKKDDISVKFERDELGRVVVEHQDEHFIKSRYDGFGLRTERLTSLGHHVAYGFGQSPLVTSANVDEQYFFKTQRDGFGREIRRFIPGNIIIDNKFNSIGELTEQRVGKDIPLPDGKSIGEVSGNTLVHRRFEYDASGELVRCIDNRWGTVTYRYDIMGRLLNAQWDQGLNETFGYDLRGNRTRWQLSRSRPVPLTEDVFSEYGKANQILRAGDTAFEYDDEGRMTRKVENAGSKEEKTWQYEWNSDGLVSAVICPDKERWRYAYDALGRRILKTGPNALIRYVWDKHDIVHEIVDNGKSVTWINDQENGWPLAKIEDGELYSCINDHIGVPKELIDEDGHIVWAGRLLSWGRLDETDIADIDCPIRFPGQWYDPESGLHYNRFRYYSPDTGMFISRDPIRLKGGTLEYAFALNPFMWFDFFGLDKIYVVRENNDPNGQVIYVGITDQKTETRQGQHRQMQGRQDWELMPLKDANGNVLDLDHGTARGVEQGLIEHYGIEDPSPEQKLKKGPLKNKINSMSPKRDPKVRVPRMKDGKPYVDDFLEKEDKKKKKKKC